MTQPLSEIARAQGINYFLLSFTDLLGIQRAKLVPASVIDFMAEGQAGFAGFAAWLDLTPADPDVFAQPERERLFQLPWQPEVAWMPADLIQVNGDPLPQTPRWVLKKVLSQAEAMGFQVKTGIECEFMLLSPEEWAISDERDRQAKPCYDQQSLMRRFSVIRDVCDGMQKLGWDPYQNDHEDANGQFEMNWRFDDALVTADRHAFFKYMVKSIAEKHGYRATFMPKPFAHLTGNGCHTHISLWQGEQNLFADPQGELGLSQLAYHFIGGVLHHAPALCASPTQRSILIVASMPLSPSLEPPGLPIRSATAAIIAPTPFGSRMPGGLNCVWPMLPPIPIFWLLVSLPPVWTGSNTNGILAPAVTTTPTPIPSPMPQRCPALWSKPSTI
jgi:glutamine synthetase